MSRSKAARLIALQSDVTLSRQRGGGLISTGLNLVRQIYDHAPLASAAEAVRKVIDVLPSGTDLASDSFPGERHGILALPAKGVFGTPVFTRANFLGPGTRILERVRRGDKPQSFVDALAEAHDLRYAKAKTDADLAAADEKFMRGVDEARTFRADNPFNIAQARLIEVKRALERLGLPKDMFTTPGGLEEEEDRKLIDDRLAALEARGLGLGRKLVSGITRRADPAQGLRKKVLAQASASASAPPSR